MPTFRGVKGCEDRCQWKQWGLWDWQKLSKEEVFQGEDGMVEPYSGRVQGDSSEGHMEILVASEEGAGVTLGLLQRLLCCGSWGWGWGWLQASSEFSPEGIQFSCPQDSYRKWINFPETE